MYSRVIQLYRYICSFFVSFFFHIDYYNVYAQSLQLCLILQTHGLQPTRFLCSWGSPGKKTCISLLYRGLPFFLQGVFLTQGLNTRLLHLLYWQVGSLPLASPGKPTWEDTLQSDSVIHIHMFILFQILFPYRLLQNIEYSSLCHNSRSLFPVPQQCGRSDSKESACSVGRPGFEPWIGKVPWRRARPPAPVFLPGKSPWIEGVWLATVHVIINNRT